jgi:transposase
MAQSAGDVRALRAELAELRAVNAELRRGQVLLTEQVSIQQELIDTQRAAVQTLTGQVQALTEVRGLLEAENRLLRERVAELERRLGQNPRNSDKPPSSEGYEKPPPRSRREVTDRPSGGQPGHQGRTLRQVQEPDERVVHSPTVCAGCGASLAGAPVTSTEGRQVFDLPEVALRVTAHVLEHRRCGCGQTTMAAAPAGVGAPVQYGPGLRGLATYLLAAQYLPLARCAELLAELLGAPVSEGTLAAWYAAAAAGLAEFDAALADRLAHADVLGADETGARVDGRLAWIHALRTDRLTLYSVSAKRGAQAMTAAGVLPVLGPDAVLVHDFWSPYWTFAVTHAVCGAHLLRELAAAAEVDGQAGWAEGLDRLLGEIDRTVLAARDAGADELAPGLLAAYQRRYNDLIEAGWAANPEHHPGGRGKRRRPRHVNLLDRLDGHRDEVLRFATDLRVPFTNNGSEQDVRPVKIRMKIAGCLRTMAGAEAFCRLRSYLSTARKQGQPGFLVLRMLHDSDPWMPAALQMS